MKALSIQQPWASLTASGVKDVENRTWRPKNNPGKFLIYTGSRRATGDFYGQLPLAWLYPAINLMNRGFIEDFNDMPQNCIVGVAEISDITTENRKIWSDARCEWKFELTNAKLFKTPIEGIKGKLNFFDVPEIDENDLPETIDIEPIRREGKTLIVPVHEDWFILDGGITELEEQEFEQFILPENTELYLDSEGRLIDIETIRFINKELSAEFHIDEILIKQILNENGKIESERRFDGRIIDSECVCFKLGRAVNSSDIDAKMTPDNVTNHDATRSDLPTEHPYENEKGIQFEDEEEITEITEEEWMENPSLKNYHYKADGTPMKFEFSMKGIDVEQMIEDSLKELELEMIRLAMTPEKGEQEHFVFYLKEETTQGVELILKKRKGFVVIPGFSSLTDVHFAFGLLRSVECQTNDNVYDHEGDVFDLDKAENAAWQCCRENYLDYIRQKDAYIVLQGTLGSYRLVWEFLEEKYPGLSDESLVTKIIDNYKRITYLVGNGNEFGLSTIKAPDSDCERETLIFGNRDGWGMITEQFSIYNNGIYERVVKIVDPKDFFKAMEGNPHLERLDPLTFELKAMPEEEWTNIFERLDGEIHSSGKTYLLRWNPAISSFKSEFHDDAVKKYDGKWCMDWSVFEWQDAHVGDHFYMLREGDGVNPGIYYRGFFDSEPYEDDDWRGSGQQRHYVDICCLDGRLMNEGAWITPEQLEESIPEINWRKGHSGELLTLKQADALNRLWDEYGPASSDDGIDGTDDWLDEEKEDGDDEKEEKEFDNDPDRFLGCLNENVDQTFNEFSKSRKTILGYNDGKALISSFGQELQIRAVANHLKAKKFDLIDLFPYVVSKKKTARLELTKIQEYKNEVEAVLTGKINDREFCFYDAEYLLNKHKYQIGEKYSFAISALGIKCETVTEDELEIHLDRDWAENNSFPIADGENEVVMHLDWLVTLLQTHNAYPAVGEFQSPMQSKGKDVHAFGKDFYLLDICLRLNDTGESKEDDVTIPLLVSTDIMEGKPSKDTPIRGILLLMGRLME